MLVGTIVLLSGIMNNVGALALLLPVAMRLAREHNTSPFLTAYASGVWLFARRFDHLDWHPAQYHYFQLSP
ncbi:hypothetical protein HORIV_29350 [Vreelandella olivaria]|uniref:Citrate transporter-like domain-containing protein n=1 Tax=Vreelandella olivaria TaxID=390919 RepID=A0ABN5WUC6_9GAMM|nr:hypothetical protein HORIV_29350 [Halomonas olivaria]